MKSIQRDELYEHLSGFLKDKGIELKEGSYANGIQKGCTLLADAINLSQKGLNRAKGEVDKKLDQMRQAVHEATAPQPPPSFSMKMHSGAARKPAPQSPSPKPQSRRRNRPSAEA